MDPLILIVKKLIEQLTEPVSVVLLLGCVGLYRMVSKRDDVIDRKDGEMRSLIGQVIGSSNALAQHTVILQTIFDYVRKESNNHYVRGIRDDE